MTEVKRHSISVQRMILLVVVLAIFAVSVVTYFAFYYIKQARAEVESLYVSASDGYVSAINAKIDDYMTSMELISLNQVIRNNIFRTDVSRADMVELGDELEKTINGITYYLYTSGELYSHRLYTYLPSTGRSLWNIESLYQKSWYPLLNDWQRPQRFCEYSSITRSWLMTVAIPINSFGITGYEGTPPCYQTITINLDKLFSYQKPALFGMDASIIVFDNTDGTILYCDDTSQAESAEKYYWDSRAGVETDGNRFFPNGEGLYLTPVTRSISTANMNLTVLFLFEPNTAVLESRWLEIFSFVLVGVLFLILLIIYLVFSWNYSRRMQLLINRIDNFDEKAGVDRVVIGKDELSRIDRHITKMQKRIQTLIEEEYSAKLQQANAQQEALIACINPHFLYNTLNTISATASMEGADDSARMIGALSKMFRYSSDTAERFVPLEKEIENVLDYLYIQGIRYKDSFTYHVHVPGAHQGVYVPKLIVQPLVENCFKHGFSGLPNARHKELEVGSYTVDDTLCIRVCDNGKGISPENVKMLQKGLEVKSSVFSGSEEVHIGLRNVQRRIQLIYGEKYGLVLDSVQGVFTSIEVRLPLHARGRKD